MDNAQIPTQYAECLTDYLNGGAIEPLLALFAERARIERYVWSEPPRIYVGLEQIEESLLRLPAVGGAFHITDVQVEGNVVHAWFITEKFAFPMRGTYRFELNEVGQITELYISAAYNRDAV
ncbi:MAG: hypothetical protein JW934_03190 [Anaerolineae bacterium]|nr:hypothetical protein [Anaerolineae bacterium]